MVTAQASWKIRLGIYGGLPRTKRMYRRTKCRSESMRCLDRRKNSIMQNTIESRAVSRKALWTGYVLGALPVLLFLFSGTMKLMKPPAVVEGFKQLGFPERVILGIGILEIVCTILYVVPPTAVIGAILLTGYLGGAIVTHLRVGE